MAMRIQVRSKSHRRRILGGGYSDEKVLPLGPIAYWPLDEGAGSAARCLVNSAQNGTYTGVTLANDATGPFGTAAPYFDGANDYVDVKTATLETLWNAGGAEWSVMCWWKVANAGVWTDGTWRRVWEFLDTANDYTRFTRHAGNNTLAGYWTGGGTAESESEGAVSSVNWNCQVLTRSESADEVKYYRNANLINTDNTIGNWASAGAWVYMLLGAASDVPANVWHGWLAHCAVWGRALTQPEITKLANP